MNPGNELWLVAIAWQLDRLRWVPRSVLGDLVRRDGSCMGLIVDDEPPDWMRLKQTDRQFASRLCAGCPVQEECLELELRTHGADTVGVWGGLAEHDRRGLHWHWRQRGERAPDLDPCDIEREVEA